jgi:hypothetical protein
MAPFTTEDVVSHACTRPAIYKMEFLQSPMGKRHIQQVLDGINKGVWPEALQRGEGLPSDIPPLQLISPAESRRSQTF